MAPFPPDLQKAMELGELTDPQIRQLIELEAREIGLSYDEAVASAKAQTLPRTAIGSDLKLLVRLLAA